MDSIQSKIKAYMIRQEWRPEKHGDRLMAFIKGQNGCWGLFTYRNEDDRWLIVRSTCAFLVPAALRNKVALFLTEATYGLILGNFEMDMSDGEVSFKTSLRLGDSELTHELMDHVFQANVACFDRCLPGLYALVHGKRSVKWALACCGAGQPAVPEPTAPPEPSSELPPANESRRD